MATMHRFMVLLDGVVVMEKSVTYPDGLRLESQLQRELRIRRVSGKARFTYAVPANGHNVEVVAGAIEAGHDLRMKYWTASRGELTERVVTPQEIVGQYMKAFCHLRQEDRTFHLGRILSVEVINA